MLARRLLVLLAVLVGLTVVASAVAPEPPRREVVPQAEARPPAAGEPSRVTQTLSARLGAPEATVRAAVGDTVEIVVEGDQLDTVVVRGLDRLEALAPVSPARFEIFAERPGRYPLVLLDAERTIGALEITAR